MLRAPERATRRRGTRGLSPASPQNPSRQFPPSPPLPHHFTKPLSPSLPNTPPLLMAPIRRYLRITKYSVLEVRIYLDNPVLASSWLLHPRKPVLPRVIEAVRPLVLPKLKEENARDRGKAKGRKKGVKDVVVEGALCCFSSHHL